MHFLLTCPAKAIIIFFLHFFCNLLCWRSLFHCFQSWKSVEKFSDVSPDSLTTQNKGYNLAQILVSVCLVALDNTGHATYGDRRVVHTILPCIFLDILSMEILNLAHENVTSVKFPFYIMLSPLWIEPLRLQVILHSSKLKMECIGQFGNINNLFIWIFWIRYSCLKEN